MVSGLTAKSNCGLALARSAHLQEPRSALATMCRGFFFWNITGAIGLANQPGQDQFPPSWLGSASPHIPPCKAPGRLGHSHPKSGPRQVRVDRGGYVPHASL